MDINSADIGHAKGKTTDQIKSLEGQVTDLQSQIAQRDTDLASLRESLTAAQADATKLTDAQAALTALQSKYDADQKDWAAKTSAQAYNFAVREKANSLNFTSEAAKRDFIAQATAKKLPMQDSAILGFDDFVKVYQTENDGAFKTEDAPSDKNAQPVPSVTVPQNNTPQGNLKPESVFGFNFAGIRPH